MAVLIPSTIGNSQKVPSSCLQGLKLHASDACPRSGTPAWRKHSSKGDLLAFQPTPVENSCTTQVYIDRRPKSPGNRHPTVPRPMQRAEAQRAEAQRAVPITVLGVISTVWFVPPCPFFNLCLLRKLTQGWHVPNSGTPHACCETHQHESKERVVRRNWPSPALIDLKVPRKLCNTALE